VSSMSPSGTERATEPKQADRSLGELFGDLGAELSTLVRQELELAKSEARLEVRRATQTGTAFAIAAVAGLLLLSFASAALAWLLDQWMNTALAFLIVALLWAIVALVAVQAGKRRAAEIEPMPRTVETLKEDVEWAKQQKS
jgi:F0F1-type ATP synthase assembly protein I